MGLKINGKDNWLIWAEFRALASTAGLRVTDADAAISDVIMRMKQATDVIALPKLPVYRPEGEAMATRMLDICRMRIEAFA